MADAHHIPTGGALPKLGRVNEICQEWMVREDGAMAYHLQDQEIRQHYSGNKQRNAMVREDYPRAKDEQIKEQELAEQAAAVYKKMLEEQEEIDKMLAERLTKKLDLETKIRKNAEDRANFHLAKRLQDEQEKPPVLRQFKPHKEMFQPLRSSIVDGRSEDSIEVIFPSKDIIPPVDMPHLAQSPIEPQMRKLSTHKSQEEADEELARMLQEQEGNPEQCILERDRLLAIEAQDKELAKVLQERERIKAKKAREKARQKSLAKKEQKRQEEAAVAAARDILMPDDAYSNPADMILPPSGTMNSSHQPNESSTRPYDEYEDNYSLPVDGLESIRTLPETGLPDYPNYSTNKEMSPARPSHLNIRPMYKPRYPDPEEMATNKPLPNIAMAIDPTYAKEVPQSPISYMQHQQQHHHQQQQQHLSPSKSGSSKSSSRSSPSSSSKDTDSLKSEMSNAPPYMPIQGQKRTASLEKRRVRDGCKQQ